MPPHPRLPAGPFLIVGLARSGIAAARVLCAQGEVVIGLDASEPAGVQELRDAGVELHLGVEDVEKSVLARVRTLVKSPGVPAQAPAIATARAHGLTVLGELELAWRLLPNEFIAVTGTNGKTTTVELIGHIHRTAGLPVAVAGNVGVALSSLVDGIAPAATIVCEASSFQLQDTLAFAPEAAVLLNLAADHLDRHCTMDDYLTAKLEIFARQKREDLALLPADLATLEIGGRARRVNFEDGRYASLAQELRLPGAHNHQNAMAAAAVCLERGIDVEEVCAGLRTFPGVAHRQELVAERDGVLYVNDSKATNVASTLVALRAYADRPIHLILGGQGKGQDFAPLAVAVREGCRAVYLIGEDAPSIAAALADAGIGLHGCETLEQALIAARAAAQAGDVVLLSPGCASFDQFADFEARGEHFRGLVVR